jgi:hypothetical protein
MDERPMVILVLDDEIGMRFVYQGEHDPANKPEKACVELSKRGADVLPFNGRTIDVFYQVHTLYDPARCAQEVLSRFRISERLPMRQPNVVLDLDWWGQPDFGERLLVELWSQWPEGFGKIVVFSGHFSSHDRDLFRQKHEVRRVHFLDKGALDKNLSALIRAFFPPDDRSAVV